MNNIEKEIEDIFNNNTLIVANTKKTLSLNNLNRKLEHIFRKNNVITTILFNDKLIYKTEEYPVSNEQTYKIVYYKNGYYKVYVKWKFISNTWELYAENMFMNNIISMSNIYIAETYRC